MKLNLITPQSLFRVMCAVVVVNSIVNSLRVLLAVGFGDEQLWVAREDCSAYDERIGVQQEFRMV